MAWKHAFMLSCLFTLFPQVPGSGIDSVFQDSWYIISSIKITSSKKNCQCKVSDQIKLFYGFNFHWLLHPHVQIYTKNHDCKDIHGFVRHYFYINLTLMAASTI